MRKQTLATLMRWQFTHSDPLALHSGPRTSGSSNAMTRGRLTSNQLAQLPTSQNNSPPNSNPLSNIGSLSDSDIIGLTASQVGGLPG